MTVCTWYTSERAAGLPICRPTQKVETRGKYNKCIAVDVEQTEQALAVTVAAGSMKECIVEFHHTAANLDIPAEKWDRFDIPLTENAIRAVNAWAGAVRSTISRTIEECLEKAAAYSSGTF